ncbi:MAG: hypothetical protein HC822_15960 [Oscillochloris sp.]|nr:hypothetical protein [Oscillochloris sp.]
MHRLLVALTLLWVFVGTLAVVPARAQSGAAAGLGHALAAAGDEHWDPRFGTPGIYEGTVRAMATAADGSLYVGGGIARVPGMTASQGVVRWDGERWHALGSGVNQNAWVYALATHGSDLYAAGDFSSAGGVGAKGIARWDGTKWNRVGSGVGPRREYYGWEEGRIHALAVAPNGDLYVGGYFNYIDNVPARGIARWDGNAWHAVGGGLYELDGFEGAEPRDANVYAISFGPDGTLYAGGTFNHTGNGPAAAIARWNGTAWSAMAAGIRDENDNTGEVKSLLFHAGKLYVGGMFGQAGEVLAAHIAAWDGAGWSALGDGMYQEFLTAAPVVALLADGNGIIAAGRFDSAGGQMIGGIARWNGTTWSPIGAAGQEIGSQYLEVHALAPSPDGGYVAAGTIDRAGAYETVFGITRWDGEKWLSLGNGVAQYGDSPADVEAIVTDDKGRVFAAGYVNYVAGMPVQHLAMWQNGTWHNIGGISGDLPAIYDMLVVGEYLYIGGHFTQAGGISALNIARWHIPTAQWSPLGAGINDTVYALAYGGGKLFAGGGFTMAGGSEALDVAIWDGTNWSALGGEFEIFEVFDTGSEAGTFVSALEYVHGELYIGGHFQVIHAKNTPRGSSGSFTAVHNLVAYDLAQQQWYKVGPEIHPGVTTNGYSGFGTDVFALDYVGGHLYVGGNFTVAGGIGALNLARYDIRANNWAAIGSPGGEELTVRDFAIYGPDLFVVGTFTTIDAVPARFVARYNTVQGQWRSLGSGLRWYNDKYTLAKAVAVSADGVYVGGKFDQAGETPALGFAHWSGPLDPTVPFDPIKGNGGDPIDPEDLPNKLYLPLLNR